MKAAYYQNKIIYLPEKERAEWQILHKEAKTGKVTCLHCGEPLQLHISLESKPTFFHRNNSYPCEKEVEAYIEASYQKHQVKKEHTNQTSRSFNGFSLPTGRSISNEKNEGDSSLWKEPQSIRNVIPFQHQKLDQAFTLPSPYRQTLENLGFTLSNIQWSAVEKTEGPLLILAGAGSGKTRVLTTRAAYMLVEKGISPKEMILVTFTAKAAKEMKQRMASFPNLSHSDLSQLMIGTFHSIFYKILMHHQPEKWNQNHLLVADWQKEKIVKEAARTINIEEKDFAFDQALTQISWWKNHLIPPALVKPRDHWEEQVLHLYKFYEESKENQNKFDFDDMLIGCYELLKQNEPLLARYQRRFHYVSIDEYQDINKVQAELIKLLIAKSRNLCVVGDDDQAIYGFRGSDPDYILSFEKEYPEAQKVILNNNYRSTHGIVAIGNKVIQTNRKRFKKKLLAQFDLERYPTLFYPYDEEEEATMVVTDIREKIESGAKPSDFAILYRTNTHMRAIFERFIDSSLPFSIEGMNESFYHRKSVRKIIAYLQLSQNPNHVHSVTELVGALFLKQGCVQDIKACSILNDCSLVEAFTHLTDILPFQQKKLKNLPKQFQSLKKRKPIEALDYIEIEMGFKDFLKKQGNEGNKMDRGSDDLRDLKVIARQFTTIEEFLNHVEHMTAKHKEYKLQRQDDDTVQLMTIHRAKGLEFKHVYIIGATEGSLPHDYALESLREGNDAPLEEERRLMYVAITRAIENLYISVPQMRRGKQAQPSRFVREAQRQTILPKSLVKG
ncbi:UvrD-helicase domain-containing protein [Alkalihalobacillus pseudalcaliphilus]|uniref:UvrD-helicase domain-containing protein n=1 Tax=Alkalihalobacillus pseudalcaliphilus TaxID=79884 RepID=UPI00064DFDDF|nr:ATP-dependent helicase [Alkalihalobacillus pseudalcaliphilus]KMK77334.1 ATP-dependent DNA helicase Rep [Alkalihalobacillus pseudalcaliphilus]